MEVSDQADLSDTTCLGPVWFDGVICTVVDYGSRGSCGGYVPRKRDPCSLPEGDTLLGRLLDNV